MEEGSAYESTPSPIKMTPEPTSEEAAKLVERANAIGKLPFAKRLDFHLIDVDESVEAAKHLPDFKAGGDWKDPK